MTFALIDSSLAAGGAASLLAMLAVAFWIYQFAFLMLLPDGKFTGRHDKIIWAVAFIAALVVSPLLAVAPAIAFTLWRMSLKS